MRESDALQGALDLMVDGNFPSALARIEDAERVLGERESLRYAKAMLCMRMNRPDAARDLCVALLAANPDHAGAREIQEKLSPESWTPTVRVSAPVPAGPYGPAAVNPTTLRNRAVSPETWDEILTFHGGLATDEYVASVDRYYRSHQKRHGRHWFYLDVVNVLYAASQTTQPRNYLEIGVRRGRSSCVVARGCPNVHIHAFDMWVQNYAGMENPGPDFVKTETRKHGHRGEITFVDGNSHETVPRYLSEHPALRLDMVLVDGDHSEAGALEDLRTVIPRMAPGGVLVFDDIAHPDHPYLLRVWREALKTDPALHSIEFTEAGYGVAFAVKMA